MKLRGYQLRTIRAINDAWAKHRSTLAVLAAVDQSDLVRDAAKAWEKSGDHGDE